LLKGRAVAVVDPAGLVGAEIEVIVKLKKDIRVNGDRVTNFER